jgi:coenzyme F420 biosynthesis associated uncharacterized protein
VDAIDWDAAQRIGELVAGSPPFGGVSVASVQPRALEFARRVADYSGLSAPAQLPALEAIDRPAWIAANLSNVHPLLGLLSEQTRAGSSPLGPLSRLLLGAQVGGLMGLLSQRVLGQYDISLLDASLAPRLLLVAPNLAATARNVDLDLDELVLWVTIHEVTHAVQFSGAPWLREHLDGMVRELVRGLTVAIDDRLWQRMRPSALGGAGMWLPDAAQLRELVQRARRGELLRLTLGEDRWQLVERMQAVMSLVEGHAEHAMDAIGAELLPSLAQLRAAMTRRRQSRGLYWRALERLLGLSLKLRQYEQGRRFCDAVVAAAGPHALARAWASPDALPTIAELSSPETWLARTSAHGRLVV